MLPDERKTCIKCNQSKPLSDYYKDKIVKTGYKSKCKVCYIKYGKQFKGKKIERIKNNKAFTNRVKTKLGCKKCGYNEHPAALSFNHIDPSIKFRNISAMVHEDYSIHKIKKEMRKCEVLCANCHNIHSYEEQHWRNSRHAA